jgi:N-acetyl-gamma-glutamyl-phosphate reductase
MTHSVGVLGASGYTGAELLRLLAGHPELAVAVVTAESNAGARVGDLYPALASVYGELRYDANDPAAVDGCEIVFCCLPHGESQRLAAKLLESGGDGRHVIDLGADFRLPPSDYERWYGEAHHAPELIERFAFGMTELFRPEIRAAQHVANPGCYPTAASLALAPLLAGNLVEPNGIVVSATSGVSGAGRGLKLTSHFSEVNENVSAYGLLTHRHTAEIEHALTHVGGVPVRVLFQPHLVPTIRGILATCFARPATDGLSTAKLLDVYRSYYAGEPFVLVGDEPSGTRATYGANTVHVTVRFDDRTGTVLAFASEDNLVKGASGQALQNANVVLGLPETTGLPTLGLAP